MSLTKDLILAKYKLARFRQAERSLRELHSEKSVLEHSIDRLRSAMAGVRARIEKAYEIHDGNAVARLETKLDLIEERLEAMLEDLGFVKEEIVEKQQDDPTRHVLVDDPSQRTHRDRRLDRPESKHYTQSSSESGENVVYIMRGIPGSGKSTKAREISQRHGGAPICSADDYFMVGGEYRFDVKQLSNAHATCFDCFKSALDSGEPAVIVDNTHTRKWEYEKYVDAAREAGYRVEIVEIPHIDPELAAERNTHGVPQEAIERMLDRWEPSTVARTARNMRKWVERLKPNTTIDGVEFIYKAGMGKQADSWEIIHDGIKWGELIVWFKTTIPKPFEWNNVPDIELLGPRGHLKKGPNSFRKRNRYYRDISGIVKAVKKMRRDHKHYLQELKETTAKIATVEDIENLQAVKKELTYLRNELANELSEIVGDLKAHEKGDGNPRFIEVLKDEFKRLQRKYVEVVETLNRISADLIRYRETV
jgi:predicted kinase